MRNYAFSKHAVLKSLMVGVLILTAVATFFTQNPFMTVLNKADDYFNKKDYCAALENYDKAMQIESLANYPMYHAAQSACQCGQPEKSFKYAMKSFANYQDFYNYEYFATDTLNKCFSETPEWKKILGVMKPKYEDYTLRQKRFQASINDQNLRLNFSAEREQALAAKLQKLPPDKLARAIRNFKNYRMPPRPDQWSLYSINIENVGEVPFLMYIPKDYRPSESKPLFVYLHGAVRGRQQFAIKSNPPEFEKDVIGQLTALNTFIIYPFAKKDFNWLLHRAAFEAITKEIAFAKTLYNINDDQVYIGGHSNGATGAFWYALNNRTNYAAFYGFALSPVLNLGKSLYANLDNAQKTYTLNGTKDDTFEFKDVSAVYEKTKPLHLNWLLQPVQDGGHNFMEDHQKELQKVFTDLLKEKRNPYPFHITEQTADENADTNFWLKVSQISRAAKSTDQPALVKAEYRRNTFTIEVSGASEIRLLIPYGMIDYRREIIVKVNNTLKLRRKLKPEKEMMLKNFLTTRDRRFLVANEISIKIE